MRRLLGDSARRGTISWLASTRPVRPEAVPEDRNASLSGNRPVPPAVPPVPPEEEPDYDDPLPLDEPPGPIPVPQPGAPPPLQVERPTL